jgi:hypothetical protein
MVDKFCPFVEWLGFASVSTQVWTLKPALTRSRSDGSAQLVDRDSSRTFAEQLSCSLKLLGFVPMHSDSQQCLNVAS